MTLPAWRGEVITRKHHRGFFDCGDAELNDFLQRTHVVTHLSVQGQGLADSSSALSGAGAYALPARSAVSS